jgi:hypothetical protein
MMGAIGSLMFPTFINFDSVRIEEQGRHAEESELAPAGIEPKVQDCGVLDMMPCRLLDGTDASEGSAASFFKEDPEE